MAAQTTVPTAGAKRDPLARLPLSLLGTLLLALAACSPALNWRSVSIGELGVTLPCKPDRVQRAVVLAGYSVEMEMIGCEADGALFAVSRLAVPKALAPEALQAQWQTAILLQMRGEADQKASHDTTAGARKMPLRLVSAKGQTTNGRELQALLAWLTWGSDMFHFAVYAPRLTGEMTEPFFDGIRAP